MKHLPTVFLIFSLSIVAGMSVFFIVDMFAMKGTSVSFKRVETIDTKLKSETNPKEKEIKALSGHEIWQKELNVKFIPDKETLQTLEKQSKEVLLNDPQNKEALYTLGYCNHANKIYASAKRYYDSLLTIDPSNKSALLARSYMYYTLKDISSSLNSLESCIKVYPDDYKILIYKANLLEKIDKKEEARKIYLTLIKKEPSNYQIKKSLYRLNSR